MALVPAVSNSADKDARERHQLTNLMRSCKCHDDVIKFVVEDLEAVSVCDFHGLVPEATFETELVELIVSKVESCKNKVLEYSRVRAAWRAARAVVTKTETRKGTNASPEDLEEALDETLVGELWTIWDAHHKFALDMYNKPADGLLGRVYREIVRCQATVIPIKKVQSLAATAIPAGMQRRDLGNNIFLTIGEEPGANTMMTIYVYYVGMRILGNTYSVAGMHEVPSKLVDGKKVRFAQWHINCQYAEHGLRKALTVGEGRLSWLQEKDELTRTKMIELMRAGWAQGEALSKALTELELAWTVPPNIVPNRNTGSDFGPDSGGNEGSDGGGQGKKRKINGKATHVTHDAGGLAICKAWNDNRGCKRKSCPHGRAHVCDMIKKNGQPCLSKQHCRMNHPAHL